MSGPSPGISDSCRIYFMVKSKHFLLERKISSANSYSYFFITKLISLNVTQRYHRNPIPLPLSLSINSSRELSSASEGDAMRMTDSLSTVSWEDINEDHEDYDQDGDDESRD